MNVLDAGIYSRLNTAAITNLLAAGSLSLFHLQAAENAAYDYCVWNIQGGGDINESPHRVKNLVVFIRAYSASGAAQAGSIDAQIDTALHLLPLTVSGWSDLWLARETDLELVQNDPSGRQVWMAGGMYRLLLEKT